MITDIGFTGTRAGMTLAQKLEVKTIFSKFKRDGVKTLHNGLCIGADANAALLANYVGLSIVGHPGIDKNGNAPTRAKGIPCVFEHPEKPYIERDHDIVDASDVLVATPRLLTEELRSGTWATIRYARKQHKRVIIVWPNGKIQVELNYEKSIRDD